MKDTNDEYVFKGQRENEEVIEPKNNHPLVLFPKLLTAMLFWFIAVAIVLFWPSKATWIVAIILFLIGLILQVRAFFAHKNTVFVVTNERLIYVTQNGFFDSSVVEADVVDVHNMISHKGGMLRSMFDYGDLTIRISDAVSDKEIIIKNIPRPYDSEALIASTKSDRVENKIKN